MLSIKYGNNLAGGAVAHANLYLAHLLIRAIIVDIVAITIKSCPLSKMVCSSMCLSPLFRGETALYTIWNYIAPPVIFIILQNQPRFIDTVLAPSVDNFTR